MTTEHTPTWEIRELQSFGTCVFHDGGCVTDCVDPDKAAFIVRACNAHEDLVAALREAQAALNGAPNTVGLHTQIDAALAKAGAA